MYAHFLYFTFLQIVFSEFYTNEDGVKLEFIINFKNRCGSKNEIFAILQTLSITQCVVECSLREHCAALNYRRLFHMCELLSVAEEGETITRGCIFIPASDINVLQNPCGVCGVGKVCDTLSQTCVFKECPIARVPENGQVLGNTNEIGAMIKYVCDDEASDGAMIAVCLTNGQWSTTVNCSNACGNPANISNGNVVVNSSAIYQNTATVTCDPGYKGSVDTISCTTSGSWETVTCDPISCGNPPSVIDNGIIVLHSGTMYMDTASVICNTNFQSSSSTISCTASGSWETASCVAVDCYINDVWDYAGTKNITDTGYDCERWDNHIGDWNIDAAYLPEASLSEAENYCRNPTSEQWNIWCFSSRPNVEWEYCDISRC
ncbi:prothrombin-like [Mercenaria mercenaria]|uniref:prothrombin-like n=1 Tax=Mercenaria mercenaria TaxID=6596 RepID=UPI00234EAA4C|nr:prothrombin-like [Mercenaria mercenaria]